MLGGEASRWLVILLARDLVDLPPCWFKNMLAVSLYQALGSWGRASERNNKGGELVFSLTLPLLFSLVPNYREQPGTG